VYKKAIEANTTEQLSQSSFSSNSVRFPFGINKLGGDVLVRDPLKLLDDGSIVCAGELFEGEFVDILHCDTQSLLKASRKAMLESCNNLDKEIRNHMTLFVDCISRYLFLGDAFREEINNVCSASQRVFGACTLGEIANTGLKYLELYNKTAVVAQIETR